MILNFYLMNNQKLGKIQTLELIVIKFYKNNEKSILI